jgi:hypothetical protein
MIKPVALSATHMECQTLKESIPVLTDLLAFEKLAEQPGEVKLKHPNTDWVLYVHETGGEAPVKQMHNHWGVRVAMTGEVDAAYDIRSKGKIPYQQMPKLLNHGFTAYFRAGNQRWEIEC